MILVHLLLLVAIKHHLVHQVLSVRPLESHELLHVASTEQPERLLEGAQIAIAQDASFDVWHLLDEGREIVQRKWRVRELLKENLCFGFSDLDLLAQS